MTNERGVVVTWLIKVVLLLVVFGSIAFDAVSIVVNYFTLDSAADDAAIALSLQIDPDQFGANDHEVFLAAQNFIASGDSNSPDAKVLVNGTHLDEQGVIHIRLRRTAKTIFVSRVEVIRKWGVATGEGQAATN